MPDEGFFMAMGGLGLSLAGFAGLITALDRSATAGSPVSVYRITGIAILGLALMSISFIVVATFRITDEDLPLTIRVGTLLFAAPYVRGFLQARPGPAWRNERERWFTIAGLSILTVATLANLVVANLGYLEFIALAGLLGPVTILYGTIRDLAAHAPAAPAATTAGEVTTEPAEAFPA